MILSLFIGALFSIIKMIQKKNFIYRFRYFSQYVKNLFMRKIPVPYYDKNICGEDGVIPFTICISLAVIICMETDFL